MTDDHSLAGLKIVVTRPRDQSVKLAHAIRQAGGVPVVFPLLEITAIADTRSLNEQIARLADFNLAIFISPNAVRYGMDAIGAAGALPEGLRVATVGQGSAKALRALGVENVIAPTERFDSEGLLALPVLQHISGWRVMIFRGDGGRELLGDTLKARGAIVEYAACYQRSKPQQGAGELLQCAPDMINVTSSEALAYLWEMLGDATDKFCHIPLFVPHPRIAALARQQGWRQIILTESGDAGLLSALRDWLGQHSFVESHE
ncbi:MAG: uroporphyrinogen-III synthase [Pseudomonadota bacterium]